MKDWISRAVTADEVVAHIKSGDNVFLHGASATPHPLIEAMVRRDDLRDVELYHLHLTGDAPFTRPEFAGRFHSNSLFTGAPLREPIAQGRAEFIPIFLSDIPALFTSKAVPLDCAMLQLSPPDQHGNCSLGTSVDASLAAAESSSTILAEINEQMPRTLGNTTVPITRVRAFTLTNRPLSEHPRTAPSVVEETIADYIADLVEDGSTLQMGIGSIPDAVLARLTRKRDLGIHTEMFSDGIVDLVNVGAITNRLKAVHPGRSVVSFVTGTKAVFDFVNNNPLTEFHPCDRTNDTAMIRKNPKVVAINSALQIDISGQVVADSLGYKIYSGIGGQMDFIRGAALSEGGKPIIALPSTASGGKISRIVPCCSPGAGVVTTRGHVHWVVTEYGAVNLHGKSLSKRAALLISIAHPDFRERLKEEFSQIRKRTLE